MIKKFNTFLHKDLQKGHFAHLKLGPALDLTMRLYHSYRNPRSLLLPGKMYFGLDSYLYVGTPENTNLCNAFDQSHRIETRIQLRLSTYDCRDHDVEVQIKFYRRGEKYPVYTLIAGFDPTNGKIVVIMTEISVNFKEKVNYKNTPSDEVGKVPF